MIFADPVYLWITAGLLPALAIFFWWTWKKRRDAIAVFVRSRLLARLTVGVSESRQLLKRVLAGIGVALVLLALAQPQWGFGEEEARSRGLDIIVALDTSRSMLATDLKPNRLQRAKLAAQDLLQLARSDRLGLVAFAGNAFLQCPLTLDEEAFRQTLLQVDTEIIPQGGTAVGEAIETAMLAFSKEASNHRILILMTDGEDHEPGALEAAKRAARDGVRIFTIGVGTPGGEMLSTTDPYGNRVFIKDDQGNAVKSRLNEPLLKELAQAADGFYLPLQNARTMATLYQRGLAPLPRGEGTSHVVRRLKERFQWPLAIAIVVLVVELFIRDHRRVAKSDAIVMASNTGLKASVGGPVAMLLLLLGALLHPPSLAAAPNPDSARKLFDRKKYDASLSQYEELLKTKPNDSQLSFNAGTAAFRKGDLTGAAQYFRNAAEGAPDDPALQQKAYYNLGTTTCLQVDEAKELPQKLSLAGEATQHLEAAVRLDPRDERATNNLAIARRRLEELQKQMPKQPQKQSGQDDKKKDEDDKKDESPDSKPQPQDEKDKDQQDSSKSDPSQQDQQQQQQQQSQPNEQKPEDSQKQQQQDSKGQDDRQPPDQEKTGENPDQGAERPGEPKNGEDAEERAAAQAGKMTPAMAEKLLDQQKGDEKAMLFRLLENKNKPRDRQFKNW